MQNQVDIVAEGQKACFTRPSSTLSRRTYRAITPSAAIGILESVFWKPQMRWLPREIQVLRPVKTDQRTTMELGEHATPDNRAPDRAGARTEFLRDAAYRIKAEVEVVDSSGHHPHAYLDQFNRRIDRGERFRQPYMGMRRFPADVRPPEKGDTAQDVYVSARMPVARGEDDEPVFSVVDYEDGVATIDRSEYEPALP